MKEFIDIKQAVIFAGGRGERLRPLTDKIPKPMAPVNGIPFLDYLIDSLTRVGIKKVLFLLGYKSEIIMNRYKDSLDDITEFQYSIGSFEDNTGRRLLNAYNLLEERFLLLYGDNYWPIQLAPMVSLYSEAKAAVSTTVFNNKRGTGEYGWGNNVEVGNDNYVKRYDKSRNSLGLNGVDIGYFLVSKKALDPMIKGNISFEVDVLPEFIASKQLVAYVTDIQYYFITTFESLAKFETFARENNVGHLTLR
jgi:D-glycero-D-manno-heptose 1,7-bisphosphate phosphatase